MRGRCVRETGVKRQDTFRGDHAGSGLASGPARGRRGTRHAARFIATSRTNNRSARVFFEQRERRRGGDARERRKASVAGPIARVRSRSRPTGHRLRAHHAARHQSRTRGRHRRRAARSPPKLFASRTRYPPGVPSQLCQKPYSEDASLREPFADRPSSVLPPNRPRLPPRRLPRLSSRRSARRMTST